MAMEIKGKPLKKQTDTIPLKMMTVGKWMHIGWTKYKKKKNNDVWQEKNMERKYSAATYTITEICRRLKDQSSRIPTKTAGNY